jgi:hypothetical protein
MLPLKIVPQIKNRQAWRFNHARFRIRSLHGVTVVSMRSIDMLSLSHDTYGIGSWYCIGKISEDKEPGAPNICVRASCRRRNS